MSLNFKIKVGVITSITLFALFTMFLNTTVYAHRSGCHRWHSCPSDSGSYTCGDTGYNNYCGSSTYIKTVPVVTNENLITYEDVPFEIVNKNNPNEYVGYSKLLTQGIVGRNKISTNVKYIDGIESSRDDPIKTTESYKSDAIYSIGTRTRPTAYIDYIWNDKSQYFLNFEYKKYKISAAAPPNKNYALIKNEKVISLDKSNSSGLLSFEGVELKGNDKISIGSYSGNQILWFMPSAEQISETSTVDLKELSVISEYDKIHKTSNKRIDNSVKFGECTQLIKDNYIKSLSKTEKIFFEYEKEETIYFTDIPCIVKNLEYKK